MLFNSVEYFIILPTVLVLCCSLNQHWKNRLLLAASYFSYDSWDWRFLGLLLVSTVADYTMGWRFTEFRIRAGASDCLRSALRVSFDAGMRELIEWSRKAEAKDKFEEAAREFKEQGLA